MLRPLAVLCALGLTVGPALAERGGHRGFPRHPTHDWHHDRGPGHSRHFCPPGLASRGCVPPGQLRHRHREYYRHHDAYRDHRPPIRLGDRIDDNYLRVDPYRYGLDPRWRYYRYRDTLVRVDPDSLQIVALLGLLSALTR